MSFPHHLLTALLLPNIGLLPSTIGLNIGLGLIIYLPVISSDFIY